MMSFRDLHCYFFLLLVVIHSTETNVAVEGFASPPLAFGRRSSAWSTTQVHSGDGIANGYRWHEEAFEIEVSVDVPPETKPADIFFKATPNSIELRRRGRATESESKPEDELLLDPSRQLRGRVSLEGTYWVISDPNDSQSNTEEKQVTVTIEKQHRTPRNEYDDIEVEWKGVYRDEEKDEVSYRHYDEPEEFNVREYAAKLGVDIDNIDPSKVDKSMFGSGLNVTQNSLDSLKEAGFLKEVTRQSDGSEWVDGEDGDRTPFSSYGEGVSKEEAMQGHDAEEAREDRTQDGNFIGSTSRERRKREASKQKLRESGEAAATDPIDNMTVAKLKDALRAQELKVSGTKKELQERLRARVQTLLAED